MNLKAEIGVMLLRAKKCLGLPASHQKLGEKHGTESPGIDSSPVGRTSPADTLTSDSWVSGLGDKAFPLFQPLSVWSSVTAAADKYHRAPRLRGGFQPKGFFTLFCSVFLSVSGWSWQGLFGGLECRAP